VSADLKLMLKRCRNRTVLTIVSLNIDILQIYGNMIRIIYSVLGSLTIERRK